MSKLAPRNRHCFAFIISILKSILDNTNKNKMPLGNLVVCFSNSLTQDNKGLRQWFPLGQFYEYLVPFLNEDGSDFALGVMSTSGRTSDNSAFSPISLSYNSQSIHVK